MPIGQEHHRERVKGDLMVHMDFGFYCVSMFLLLIVRIEDGKIRGKNKDRNWNKDTFIFFLRVFCESWNDGNIEIAKKSLELSREILAF